MAAHPEKEALEAVLNNARVLVRYLEGELKDARKTEQQVRDALVAMKETETWTKEMRKDGPESENKP